MGSELFVVMAVIVYMIYNTGSGYLGKIRYHIRRLSATSESSSPCAVTDLIHGGTLDREKDEWIKTKHEIPAVVQQLHQDQLPIEVCCTQGTSEKTSSDILSARSRNTSTSTTTVTLA